MPRGKAQKSLDLIASAYTVLSRIQPASVRAVCYQLFTRGEIDSMAKSETNRVSTQLTWARENGAIPWHWIVDETRRAERVNTWGDRDGFVESVLQSYRFDRWSLQSEWIEVWSEKGTIRGTLAPVLDAYGVTFRVMHGYTSATTAYQVALETRSRERWLHAFYLGDWDPSGMHMSEFDLPTRLEAYNGFVKIHRLALAEEDLRVGLPSFKADTKKRDPRYRWFVDRYGKTCWELDALSPVVLRARVEEAIRARLDLEAWERAEVVERAERDSLTEVITAWNGISGQASK